MPLGVADEPVVIVKRLTDDAHGDMSRGENKTKVQQMLALGKKTAAEVKGGTCNQASNQTHEGQGELEKGDAHIAFAETIGRRAKDVNTLQRLQEDASRSEIPSNPIERKETVQWNN